MPGLPPPAVADPRVDIRRFLHPLGVAIVGASDDTAKFGGRVMHYLLKHGSIGTMAPVNPRRADIMSAHPTPREVRERLADTGKIGGIATLYV